MITPIKQNTAHPLIVVLVDNKGDFKTGETITYEVRKSSDNSLVTSGTLTNTGNIYTDSISISDLGEYYVLYFTPTKFENGLENIVVNKADINDIQDDLTSIAEKLTKVLGLVYSNYRTSNHTFNSNNCLTSAKISIYKTASDTENQINPIAEFAVNYTYDSNNRLIGSKIVEN